MDLESLPATHKTTYPQNVFTRRKKVSNIDIYDYRAVLRNKPEKREKEEIEFVQQINFRWLFVLSNPTIYFLSAIFYYASCGFGGDSVNSFVVACEAAKEYPS